MRLRSKKVLLAGVAGLSLLVTTTASASLLPGGLGSDIFGGGGNIFGGGGDFFDFGSGDLFGGSGGGDWANPGPIFGGDSGGQGNPIGDLISGTIDGGGLGSSNSGSIFDSMFGNVAQKAGIPPEIMDVINGGDPMTVLDGVIGDVLGDLGLGDLDDVLGKSGIPDLEDTLEILYSKTKQNDQDVFGTTDSGLAIPEEGGVLGAAPEMITANVMPSLIRQTQALAAVTEATTAVGLTREGQELTAARREAGTTVVGAAEQMGSQSTTISGLQVQVAQGMDPTVKGQTSTQSTLKEALTTMALLDAQATQLDAFGNEQRALGLQLDTLSLDTAIENRDGIFANATNTQYINEQILTNRQREITNDTSSRIGLSRGIRTIGVMK
ncbi:MAG: hypothetical protein AAFY17_12045 [Cyanobacteria bacterium J06642_11]